MGSSVCDRSECDSSSNGSFAYHITHHSSNYSSRGAYAHSRARASLAGEDSGSECCSSNDDCLADAGDDNDCDSLAGAPSVAPSASCAGSSAIGSVVDYRYEGQISHAMFVWLMGGRLFMDRR